MTRKLRVLEIQPGDDEAVARTVDLDYDYLRNFVGGFIEHGMLANGELPSQRLGFYVHEEGLIIGLPDNWLATALYNATHTGGSGYPIAGPMIVVGGPDEEGDELGVSDAWIAALRNIGLAVREES